MLEFLLEIEKLNKSFKNRHIFTDFSIQITDRRSCLVAPNGSGKSTLLCMIAGLESIGSGSIKLDASSVNQLAPSIAVASDKILYPDFLTPTQIFSLNQKFYDCDWPSELIQSFALSPHIDKKVTSLSAGSLKKTQIIAALMRKPKLLLLDEPNTALDHKSTDYLWQLLEDFEGPVLAASNEPELFKTKGFSLYHLFENHQGF